MNWLGHNLVAKAIESLNHLTKMQNQVGESPGEAVLKMLCNITSFGEEEAKVHVPTMRLGQPYIPGHRYVLVGTVDPYHWYIRYEWYESERLKRFV
jgi:hypothetical protein